MFETRSLSLCTGSWITFHFQVAGCLENCLPRKYDSLSKDAVEATDDMAIALNYNGFMDVYKYENDYLKFGYPQVSNSKIVLSIASGRYIYR